MKTFIPFLVLLFIAGSAFAQMKPGMPPPPRLGGPMFGGPKLQQSYADSTPFKKEFEQLYPLIKETPTVKERAEKAFMQQSRSFKQREIDSAKAYDSVMKAIDPEMEKTILFDAYRADFSAEEMKTIVTFFKTPAGKHYLEVEPRLISVRSMTDQYVNRTVSRVLSTMGKPMETPRGFHPGMRPGMRPGMQPGNVQEMPQGTTPPAPPTTPPPAKQ